MFLGVNEIIIAFTPSVYALSPDTIEVYWMCKQCKQFFYRDFEIIEFIDLYSIYKLYKFYNSPYLSKTLFIRLHRLQKGK